MSYIGGDDLIFYTDNNQIYSGGFNVNSIMMKTGISPFSTLNKINNQIGGNVSDLFKDLVVPSWLLSQENKFNGGFNAGINKNNDDSDSDDDAITNDLHDNLLNLVTVKDSEIKNKKKSTKKFKNKVNKNKITKKNI